MWNTIKLAANTLTNKWGVPTQPLPPVKPTATGLTGAFENATVALGKQLRSLGDSLGQRPTSIGLEGAASFTAAKGLETAGRYLEREGFGGAMKDVAAGVKRHPLPFIALGVGLGVLLGRMTVRRS